ncbi:hypothetical protein ATK17_1645 [Branchiibius hedensis]|uniref:Ribbon-helix-helix protein, copG family n=1 Tax=Branchiibius hedensis TaxID=672460 RepID=A0A2Y8ZSQ6_9MICO|nr:DUF6364 family protein [Branchiibius hedensis]PWJ25515.1 hypothetical protein ATK17_1645 [Branchiibius hedensis]SSA34328.1 hypothetical protein SAMN04489750_1645 [Branchiibius hedensis]
MATRNLTVSLPEELVRKAKIIAAERDTSVSALLAELVEGLTSGEARFDTAWRDEVALMRSGSGLQVGDVTWSRDELHER